MRVFLPPPDLARSSYRPAPPFVNAIFFPHWDVVESPVRVIVRARTQIRLSNLILLVIVTAVIVSLGVVIVTTQTGLVRFLALLPLTLGLLSIWSAVVVPLFRVGPEPTLIEFDRRTGRVRLPRAALELRIDQVQRIERVEFEVLAREGRHRGIRHIYNVLAYTNDEGEARYVFLFHAEFRRTCCRIAEALHVPLLDINVGVVGAYEENA